jgi:hydroxymethylpyrimidine pyrophosphatase-like HAD family hydrolase
MKLAVIALDYDGTIAFDDEVHPAVRQVIAAARTARIVVLLVTGRRLADLARVAGDLHFVDAIVAENGAVLHFPASGHTTLLAPPPARALLDELSSRRIPHVSGQCLIEADADDAPRILEAIRTRELPVCQLFNRGRVMLLPQSISKATGLREALAVLRLSPHSALAVGDAENDHDLLQVCEVGAAVAWGSATLRAGADVVIDGSDPGAVAAFLAPLVRSSRLPFVDQKRRALFLGHTDEGEPFELAVRGRNLLVAGDARSGKSWVAGLLAEQLILQRYSVCVIDPEGDYRPLEALPGVVTLGGADPLPRPHELIRALRHAESSVVIDLSHLAHRQKVDYVGTLLPAVTKLRSRTGFPHRVVVDEAHYFLTDLTTAGLLDLYRNGYTLVTYRASHLPREVLNTAEVVLVTSETDPDEVKALHALCGVDVPIETWAAVLGSLAIGEAAALPRTEEAGSALRRIHLAPRLTHHVRHREKYVDIPVSEAHAFVVTTAGRATGRRARTLRDLVAVLDETPAGELDGHLRCGDLSRWVADVFGDYPLAATIQALEQRCCREEYSDAAAAIASAVRGRYDLSDDSVPAAERSPAAGREALAV